MSLGETGNGRAEGNPYSLERGLTKAEALNIEDRKVQDQGGEGDSVCINLTQKGANHHSIEIGQMATVKTFEEGILIIPINSGDS